MILRLVLALVLAAGASEAQAADITVLSAGAINAVAMALAPDFETGTGHTVFLRNDTAGALVQRIAQGEVFDVVLMPPSGLDALRQRGSLAPGPAVVLARVGIGVAVKIGDPVPDISTVAAFKTTLLNARSVAYIDPASGGSSGIYLAGLFQKMGIAQAMAPKSVLIKGGLAAKTLLDGQADIALQQVSELLAVPGVSVAGPLPAEIQMETTYAGAIAAASAEPAAARAFLDVLAGPLARPVIASHGMTPP
jgi:molybdate transport system substrate-binding protein